MLSISHTLSFYPLLEHLTIRPLIGLPPLFNRLVPAPLVLHELLVLLLLRVQLGEAIALVVWGNVKCGLFFLTTDDEGTADDAIVSLAVDGGAAEDVFAGGFEAGEKTTCSGLGVSIWI